MNCEYGLQLCPSEGCGLLEQRRFLNNHLLTCPYHQITCPNHCGKVLLYSNLSDHLVECPSELVCPNSRLPSGCTSDCLERYNQADLEKHKNTIEYLRIEMMKILKDQVEMHFIEIKEYEFLIHCFEL